MITWIFVIVLIAYLSNQEDNAERKAHTDEWIANSDRINNK